MKLSLFVFIFFLTGCGLFGPKAQVATRLPLYTYKADIKIFVDGKVFDGMAVTDLSESKSIRLKSRARFDLLTITSPHREFTKEKIDFDDVWFGLGGKSAREYTYEYSPLPIEKELFSPLYIQAFEKNGIAAWGYIAFRSTENLPAMTQCNGKRLFFPGISVCQTRSGFEQGIDFDRDVTLFTSNDKCKIEKKSARSFRLRGALGFCLATFQDQKGDKHRFVLLSYDEILVRDN